ncbi:hypothetical protein JXA34_01915 [Patescibacteria group bacterium]|nr:hypothetical protein [Patescibacteria group bacterium]
MEKRECCTAKLESGVFVSVAVFLFTFLSILKLADLKPSYAQDLSWGVLAINTNKSVYTPGEVAKIDIAVLDHEGEMVCDAELRLAVVDPLGRVTILSTADNTIKVNPECKVKGVVNRPDFEAVYSVGAEGKYEMKLETRTSAGSYSITDSFVVKKDVLFDVERITATRIYPVKDYPAVIKVVPNTDFRGRVTEIVPSNFEIKETSEELFELFTGLEDEKYAVPYSTDTFVGDQDGAALLRWDVNWKKGETYYLTYSYNAPDMSPEYYTLGPVALTNEQDAAIFTETRNWEVASDAATIALLDSASNGTAGALSLTFSHTLSAGANRMVIVLVGIENGDTVSCSSSAVTYGGENMTRAVTELTGTSGFRSLTEIWYLLEADLPSEGSNNVVITCTGTSSAPEINGVAMTLEEVDQTAPDDTNSQSQTSTADISTSIVPVVDNSWLIDALTLGDYTVTPTVVSPQTEEYSFQDTSSYFSVSTNRDVAAGSDAMAWTHSSVNREAHAVIAIAPHPGAVPITLNDPFDNIKLGDSTPSFDFTAYDSDGTAGIIYQIQIDDTYDFSSAFIDCESDTTCTAGNGSFSNTVTVGDTSPFNENEKVRFTPTTPMTTGTVYYWRARGEDAASEGGSGAYGEWSAIQSVTYIDGTRPSEWFQTADEQFDTGTLDLTQTTGSDSVELESGLSYYGVISGMSPDYWWRLDGDETDSADSANSDGGNDPSWAASIIPAISATNECGNYNGTNDETYIPNQTDINSATTYQKSISVWIDADTLDTSSNGRVIWGEGGTYNGLALYIYGTSLYFLVYESSNRDYISTTISTGTLYHIGVTLDTTAQEMYLYIDGDVAASDTDGLNIGSDFAAHSAGAAIGGVDSNLVNHSGSTMSGFFDGDIADVVYWAEQTVLSENDFETIYAAGVGEPANGYITSPTIDFDSVPGGIAWNQFLFSDTEPGSNITYDIQYWDGDSWENTSIVDQDFSPVDISGLDPSVYNEIRIVAFLEYVTAGPTLYDWTITWYAPDYTQNDFEWFVTTNSVTLTNLWPPGNGDNFSENTAITPLPVTNRPLIDGDQIRIQMNLAVSSSTLLTDKQTFKLQYSAASDCTTASSWTDVGAKSSGSIWRLFDETGIGDTTPQVNDISTSTSSAEGFYSEINPTGVNPNEVAIGENVEWDWPVENNGAAENTTYCFRMVKGDGTVFRTYNSDSYPKLNTAPGVSDFMRHGNFFTNLEKAGYFWAN